MSAAAATRKVQIRSLFENRFLPYEAFDDRISNQIAHKVIEVAAIEIDFF